MAGDYFVHPSSYVDQPCEIGAGHEDLAFLPRHGRRADRRTVQPGPERLRRRRRRDRQQCQDSEQRLGLCRRQLEDDVFCGPSCVFTNVINPRSQIAAPQPIPTHARAARRTIGANATIVCGATIGRYAFIGAGAVVRGDVPDYALMLGVPARSRGWMSRHGHRLPDRMPTGIMVCPESGWRYGRSHRACCAAWIGRRCRRAGQYRPVEGAEWMTRCTSTRSVAGPESPICADPRRDPGGHRSRRRLAVLHPRPRGRGARAGGRRLLAGAVRHRRLLGHRCLLVALMARTSGRATRSSPRPTPSSPPPAPSPGWARSRSSSTSTRSPTTSTRRGSRPPITRADPGDHPGAPVRPDGRHGSDHGDRASGTA